MLGVGWTEMLVIGVVALIVIGPKELPNLMHRIGKFAGTIRRMGQDFQRELNKTTGLDEVKNLRASITAPLKATTDAIRKEFNTVTPTGEVKPSGAIKPADPNAESVVDEIKAAAGMKPLPLTAAAAAAANAPSASDSMKDAVSKRMAEIEAAKTAPVAGEKPARVKAAPRTAAATPAKPKAMPKKAAAAKKPAEAPATVEAVAPAKPKKVAVKKAAAEATPVAEVKAPAKRKPAAKKAAAPTAKPAAKA